MKYFFVLLAIACGIQFSFAKQNNTLALICKINTPEKVTATTPIIILLHGYGSNEVDLFDMKELAPANAIFVCPRAPIENGDNSYKWYEIDRNTTPTTENTEQAEASIAKILLLITQLKKLYHTQGKVVLGGFSQGAILSNTILSRSPKSVNGIISLSGRMMTSILPKANDKSIYKKIKVLQIHGTEDQVITIDKGEKVAEWMKKIGVQHDYHKLKMAHSINAEAMEIIRKWLVSFAK